MVATTTLSVDMSSQGFSEEAVNAVTMSMAAGQLLPEIYESVLLVRDIILNDQLPHFRATQNVKEQLNSPQTIEGGEHALDVLDRVQERLLQQTPTILDQAPVLQNQGILPPASTLERISFPSGAAFNEWQQDGTDPLQGRQRKPLRHLRFESKSQDEAITNIALADLTLMTGDLMTFSKRDASPSDNLDFVPQTYEMSNKRAHEDAESVFDENDYYSSQADSSVCSSPRLSRSKGQPEVSSFVDKPAITGELMAAQREWGQTQLPSGHDRLAGGLGSASDADVWGNSPDISEDSEDYTPPAAHAEYSDDDGEYDPMQLEPESDYDPNDLEDTALTTAKKTPVVTSRLTQIAAPQPSRVSTHTVSKMSTMANTGTARSPAKAAASATGLPASLPSIEPYDPSFSDAMFQQQQSYRNQGLSQSKHQSWNTTARQSAPTSADVVSHNRGKHSNKSGKARQQPAVYDNDSSQIGRTRQDRPKKGDDTATRRERKKQRRQARAERERQPALPEHSSREVHPPPHTLHMPVLANPHGGHQASAGVYEGMMPPPHMPERSMSRAIGHEYMPPPPPGRPATTLQVVPYGSMAPGYHVTYPHTTATMYGQPPSMAQPLSSVSGRTSVVPIDRSYQQPPPARVLAPGETTLVRDQHGNIYFARPVAAPPKPVYPPQPVYRYPPY
ncbi:hypothetical protein K461DRAFT_320176 [Myriangium duriaei CBS 260.36]|uniref:Uncharacterized protein n=1 Tax=Myriangium duriaei CBS 260.36 TaxID=1168546 RepID=A0A9P4J6A5_9PEZI|nr:hypothetical protein K461DRAFT_320176 [Myriangium duriaei CBS 260.36]